MTKTAGDEVDWDLPDAEVLVSETQKVEIIKWDQ